MSSASTVLTINAGSSSLRLALFRGARLEPVASWHDEGVAAARFNLVAWLHQEGLEHPDAVVHRVVHGGVELRVPCRVDAAVEAAIERLVPLAPLHNPAALHWIRAARQAFGSGVPQVVVFDTGFYANLPAAAAHYALPAGIAGETIRRYGFHGIAHQSMIAAWRALEPRRGGQRRSISLQLGAGCSITAAIDGQPVETSMGYTPLEGLVMATRSGDVDPGVLLHLQRERGMSPAELEKMLNHESGLLGLSGISGDLRTLLASPEPAAGLAIDVYCHRIRKYLGAYLAVMAGADAILFGGGVGENSAVIRERVLDGFGFAGMRLDPALNRAAGGPASAIHASDSAVAIHVLAVDEARELALAAARLLTTSAEGTT